MREAPAAAEQGAPSTTAPMSVPLARQIVCVKRELAMRRNLYPRFVADGRRSKDECDDEIAVMAAVLATLEGLARERTGGGGHG